MSLSIRCLVQARRGTALHIPKMLQSFNWCGTSNYAMRILQLGALFLPAKLESLTDADVVKRATCKACKTEYAVAKLLNDGRDPIAGGAGATGGVIILEYK